MTEIPKRSLREEIEEAAAQARGLPPYMRTQSSAARFERDMSRLGYDPRFGKPALDTEVELTNVPENNDDAETERMRKRPEYLDQFRLQRP